MAKWPKRDNAFLAWYPACANENEAAQVWEPRTAAFYVHIPFCSAICDYCGFAVTRTREANIGRYLDALEREIETYADKGRLANYRFDCGHFGGGTPSVLEAEQLTAIHALIRQSFDVSPDAEVTVEVNPISFSTEKAEAYAASGVNRISVAIQSFDDSTLRVIGRPHRAGDVEQALKVLTDVGWDNFSLDIMYGGPGQTPEQLEADLIRAVDSGATHLSCFRLEIIPFTALKLREAAGLTPPRHTDQAMDELNDVVSEVLTNAGFRGRPASSTTPVLAMRASTTRSRSAPRRVSTSGSATAATRTSTAASSATTPSCPPTKRRSSPVAIPSGSPIR